MTNEIAKNIAALDLGSNSFHLLVASIKSGKIQILHREKHLLRLSGIGDNYVIDEEKINEAILIISHFVTECEKYSAFINAVATSAFRDAENKNELISRIKNETGVTVKIISGEEEAELALLSLKYSIKKLPQKFLLFDLGGGSTEFIFVENDRIIKKFSLQLGAVRFAKKYCDSEGNIIYKEKFVSEIKKGVKDVKDFLNDKNEFECYGMGGTVSAITNMIEAKNLKKQVKFEKLKGCSFTKTENKLLIEIVSQANTLEKKKNIVGLENSRADIISIGLLILDVFFTELNISKVTFSGSGLREGILLQSFDSD